MQLRKADIQRLVDHSQNWKDIPGLEGYAAYWKGAVLNKETNRVLTNTVYKNGYVYVSVSGKNKRLHRLIAATYLPNTYNKPEVNHKAGIKQDNHVSNIEWAAPSENKKHAYTEGLNKGSKPQLGKFNELSARSKPVIQYDLNRNIVKEWPSIAEAQRHGFSVANICKVCKGERPTHKGFIWKYLNN
jgi:hypothetical protein